MDNCGYCKKFPIVESSKIKEVNGILGRVIDSEYLVHVKTTHGIEPNIFCGMLNHHLDKDFQYDIKAKNMTSAFKYWLPDEYIE